MTPHQSIANSLLEAHEQGRPLKKIVYVWALKELKLSIVNTMIDAGLFPITKEVALQQMAHSTAGAAAAATGAGSAGGVRSVQSAPLHGDSVLCTEIYCTSGAPKTGAGAAQAVSPIDPDADMDPKDLEGGADVRNALKYGRPDMVDLFKRVKALALSQGEARVAVSVCGPAALVESVAAACRATTSKEVQFDIHIETFEL